MLKIFIMFFRTILLSVAIVFLAVGVGLGFDVNYSKSAFMQEEPAIAFSQMVTMPTASTASTSISNSANGIETLQPKTSITYSFGNVHDVNFRVEVEITNNGNEVSKNIRVSVPLPENDSPYQTTSLISTNYPAISSTGRVSTFNVGDLSPGETKAVVVDYNMSMRPVSINSTNDTVEIARQAYNKYAGSGNCYKLAVAFVNQCNSQGVDARVVTGYARTQRTNMTPGSLAGFRHSWAEFYVEGLGWVPVDLTFRYFGEFPYASHVVETYNDESIRVRFQGGSLGAVWKNSII